MKCPKNHESLTPTESEGAFGWVCNDCQGILLRQSEITAVKYNHHTDVLEFLPTATTVRPSELACPSCHHGMEVKILGEVLLDVCPSCRSVWFDATELEKIIDENSQEAPKETIFDLLDFLASLFPWG